ncbi:hypothetical protein BCT59_18640 [Vibrio breoganii]|nr:hypothetical protein BCT59_18640 [Vibrio breoganii]
MLDAGTKVNRTKQQITEQLKRYIQEQSQDNRRILELIRDFEKNAHQMVEANVLPDKSFFLLDGFKVTVSPLGSRGVFQPQKQQHLDSSIAPEQPTTEVDLSDLFEVSRIDEALLQRQIQQCLQQGNGQVTLAQVVESYPIQHGLDEILSYVKMACEQTMSAAVDSQQQQTITWVTDEGVTRVFSLPLITFVREM